MFGLATFFSSIDATLEVTGPSADLLVFQDPFTDIWEDNDSIAFPSFIFNSGAGDWDPVTRTLTANAAANGAANYSGTPDPATTGGVTRFASAIGVYNPTEFGIFLDVNVSAFFQYEGSADDQAAEAAETVGAFGFFGDPELVRTPMDSQLIIRRSTRSVTPASNFDVVSSLVFQGEPTSWSILIPPSDIETSPGVINRRIWTVGLGLQAGGNAVSFGDGTLLVSDIPPEPEVIPNQDIPEPGTLVCLGVLGFGLLGRRV